VGFLAVADEFFNLHVTYKYTIRIPPSVLNECIVCGAPGTQYPRSENSESDRPHLKEIEWDLCMCDITKVYIISKFVNYGSLTQKIEACSAE